jgi:hypothetical protein
MLRTYILFTDKTTIVPHMVELVSGRREFAVVASNYSVVNPNKACRSNQISGLATFSFTCLFSMRFYEGPYQTALLVHHRLLMNPTRLSFKSPSCFTHLNLPCRGLRSCERLLTSGSSKQVQKAISHDLTGEMCKFDVPFRL